MRRSVIWGVSILMIGICCCCWTIPTANVSVWNRPTPERDVIYLRRVPTFTPTPGGNGNLQAVAEASPGQYNATSTSVVQQEPTPPLGTVTPSSPSPTLPSSIDGTPSTAEVPATEEVPETVEATPFSSPTTDALPPVSTISAPSPTPTPPAAGGDDSDEPIPENPNDDLDPDPEPEPSPTPTATRIPLPPVTFSHNNLAVFESVGTTHLTVTVPYIYPGTFEVQVKTIDDTALAGRDYGLTDTTLIFGTGHLTEQVVAIPVVNDLINEITETLTITLSTVESVSTDSTTLTIFDDDVTEIGFEVGHYFIDEEVGLAPITLTLSLPSEQAIQASYWSVNNGTALVNQDYTDTPTTTVTFLPLQKTALAYIPIIDDLLIEPTEDLTVTIANPVGFNTQLSPTIAAPLDILNDDTLTVTVATDEMVTGSCSPNHCTLREAILTANFNAGPHDVDFDISGAGPHTIALLDALPTVTETLTLNGLTQSGSTCTSWPPVLNVALDGTTAGSAVNGLTFTTNDNEVKGLAIHQFDGSGIRLEGSRNQITCNFIGTDASGMVALGNGSNGIEILTSQNNITRNLVSGNRPNGVLLSGTSATSNTIQGNFIGTDVTGTLALGNGTGSEKNAGIYLLDSANNNQIGGTTAETGNLLSGNSGNGIRIINTSHITIEGNIIGMSIAGTETVPNIDHGILLEVGANNIQIGGDENADPSVGCQGACNLISGNQQKGIQASDAERTFVQGNFIGTDVTGLVDRGNQEEGVWLANNNSTIGVISSVAERNLISGNGGEGIVIKGTNAYSNVINGNYIGTDRTGTTTIGNLNGLRLRDISGNNTIVNNLISGNQGDSDNGHGLKVSLTSGISIEDNKIGTNINGTAALENSGSGIYMTGLITDMVSNIDIIANIISGNDEQGIFLDGGATDLLIEKNKIGTDNTGLASIGNNSQGIYATALSNPVTNLIIHDNLISGNVGRGIYLTNGVSQTDVISNIIGSNITLTAPLSNLAGIRVDSSSDNLLQDNIVGGNIEDGIFIRGRRVTLAVDNVIQNNFLGLTPNGIAIPNGDDGIDIELSINTQVVSNTIGYNFNGVEIEGYLEGGLSTRTTDNQLLTNTIINHTFYGIYILNNGSVNRNNIIYNNIITGNLQGGVQITGTGTIINNQIRANKIVDNNGLGIDLGVANDTWAMVTTNDVDDSDIGPNGFQNYPIITVMTDTVVLTITGHLTSTTLTDFSLDFYANQTCDSSGFGEGEHYLGAFAGITDASGVLTFTTTFTGTFDPFITATATDVDGNTSEFSDCQTP